MPDLSSAYVNQFGSTLYALAQQKGSRLRAFVRNESQKGELSFFDRIGAATAQIKSGINSDTPVLEAALTRRAVSLSDYEWATLHDPQQDLRMLIDPTSSYMTAAGNAMGRSIDDVIIAAALGTAATGKTGSGTQTLGAGQYVGSIAGGGLVGLNVDTLRKVRGLFWTNEVDDSIPLHIVVNSFQLQSMLNQTEVTSSDYNTVKALAQGQVNAYMGFTFHHSERLATSGLFDVDTTSAAVTLSTGNANSAIQCFAWAEDGIICSFGQDIKAKIDPRPDKSYSNQVYASMSVGAVRMEENKVVGVLCAAS